LPWMNISPIKRGTPLIRLAVSSTSPKLPTNRSERTGALYITPCKRVPERSEIWRLHVPCAMLKFVKSYLLPHSLRTFVRNEAQKEHRIDHRTDDPGPFGGNGHAILLHPPILCAEGPTFRRICKSRP